MTALRGGAATPKGALVAHDGYRIVADPTCPPPLDAFGEVELEREVPPRGQTGDLWFVPRAGAPSPVELLGSLARGPTLVDLFSGPLKRRAVTGCLSKLFAIQGELDRELRRATGARSGAEASLVIMAATASQALLRGFGALPHSAGVYRRRLLQPWWCRSPRCRGSPGRWPCGSWAAGGSSGRPWQISTPSRTLPHLQRPCGRRWSNGAWSWSVEAP